MIKETNQIPAKTYRVGLRTNSWKKADAEGRYTECHQRAVICICLKADLPWSAAISSRQFVVTPNHDRKHQGPQHRAEPIT